MTATPINLPDSALPQLHAAADSASSIAQRSYKRLTRIRLWSVVAAAVAGVTAWRVGPSEVDILALVAVLLFSVALLVELALSRVRPDRAWYDGRAVAESVKTLAWKYAVCADPFPATLPSVVASKALVNELKVLRGRYPDLKLSAVAGEQVTSWMEATRSSSFVDRQETYVRMRVVDQQNWYSRKSEECAALANRWRIVLFTFEALGIAAALLEAVTPINLSLTPAIAAAIAAAVGWIQVEQYDQLSEAYSTTVSDLAGALSKLRQTASDEATWALEVNDSEDAMSREHTLWSASRSQLR